MDNKIEIYLIAFFISFILFVIGLISFFIVFKNKQKLNQKEKLLLQKEHEQTLLQTQLEIQQHTMLNIGQDIHDSVGQKLTLASLYAQQIDYDNRYPELKEKINDVGQIINESLDELRALSKNLTASNFYTTSFYDLLQIETNRIKKLGKCSIQISQENCSELKINNNAKTILLRVLQECLNNSLKHSKCHNIFIELRLSNNIFMITIKDDGIGFNVHEMSNNVGLKSMQYRIKMLKGNLDIESSSKGTKTFIAVEQQNL